MSVRIILSALVMFTLQMTIANAATFDAAGDFNATTNPNPPWSYGRYLTMGDPTSFSAFGSGSAGVLGVTGFNGYSESGALIVAKNETASPVSPGTPVYNPGSLILHPRSNGEQAVVRWTAASAGTYSISGGFFAADLVGSTTTVDGSVYRNTTQQFTGPVSGASGTNALFGLILVLTAGDTVDFVVGWGSDGNHFFDSTELKAVITDEISVVPLPAGLPLLAGGLGLVGLLARRRKRMTATTA